MLQTDRSNNRDLFGVEDIGDIIPATEADLDDLPINVAFFFCCQVEEKRGKNSEGRNCVISRSFLSFDS